MGRLSPTIDRLRELTTELAEEIKHGNGDLLSFLEMIFDYIDGTYIEVITTNHELLYVNPWGRKQIKDTLGIEINNSNERCYKKIWGADEPCSWCPLNQAINERRVICLNKVSAVPISSDYRYVITVIPLFYNGSSGAIILVTNIEV